MQTEDLQLPKFGGTKLLITVIFALALKTASSCLICCHNHPSSNTKPSQADINLTRKLVEGGKLLDIRVLDHIILTEGDNYFSFADEGLI